MHSRHDLVWLSEPGWEAALAAAEPGDAVALDEWRRAHWPLVVTRRAPDAPPGTVCLGLSMPPESGSGRKRRIALRAQAIHIARRGPALPLTDAIDGAPVTWLPFLAALRTQAAGMDLRVYGSLALQTITGRAYLGAMSDIDLLFKPACRRELADGLRALIAHAQRLPLDGEIVFPGGDAVAWKEWIAAVGAGARVLVKDGAAVRLATTESLLATLDA